MRSKLIKILKRSMSELYLLICFKMHMYHIQNVKIALKTLKPQTTNMFSINTLGHLRKLEISTFLEVRTFNHKITEVKQIFFYAYLVYKNHFIFYLIILERLHRMCKYVLLISAVKITSK